MNIQEIITKEDNYLQEEMEYVVEEYIFEKKGTRVKIVMHPVIIGFHGIMDFNTQLNLLLRAYVIASEYFRIKPKN